jgi:hypothetical protein
MSDINTPGVGFRPTGAPEQERLVRAVVEGTARNPHPQQVREGARYATYPNSAVERERLQSIDQQVFALVRVHEQGLTQDGERVIEKYAVDTTPCRCSFRVSCARRSRSRPGTRSG